MEPIFTIFRCNFMFSVEVYGFFLYFVSLSSSSWLLGSLSLDFISLRMPLSCSVILALPVKLFDMTELSFSPTTVYSADFRDFSMMKLFFMICLCIHWWFSIYRRLSRFYGFIFNICSIRSVISSER